MNSNKKQTYCLGGRPFSNTNKKVKYEKLNPRTSKLVKNIKKTCSICDRNRSQIFNK